MFACVIVCGRERDSKVGTEWHLSETAILNPIRVAEPISPGDFKINRSFSEKVTKEELEFQENALDIETVNLWMLLTKNKLNKVESHHDNGRRKPLDSSLPASSRRT